MRANNGFTLIEVIVGITIMAIVLTSITSLIAQQIIQSAGQVIQLKANELGRTMMHEILSRSFDEHSQRRPPFHPCGESGVVGVVDVDVDACTPSDEFGVDDKESDEDSNKQRHLFNDVDDFIGTYENNQLQNSLGQNISLDYPGFWLEVKVIYDSNLNGLDDDNEDGNGLDDDNEDGSQAKNLKLITVEVFTPNNQTFRFSAYKGNY